MALKRPSCAPKAVAAAPAPAQQDLPEWDALYAQGRGGAEGLLRGEPMPALPAGFNDPQAYTAGRAIAERLKAQGYCAFSSAREVA